MRAQETQHLTRAKNAACPVRHARSSTGFTIIELLVSIGVMSILVAILLPAIQSSRETARKTACLNNLKGLGLAFESYRAAKGTYPETTNAMQIVSGKVVFRSLSPHARLIPYMQYPSVRVDANEDSPDRFDAPPPPSTKNLWANDLRIPGFLCPSDELADQGTNYRACMGPEPARSLPRLGEPAGAYKSRDGAFRNTNIAHDAEFRDGKSNTILFCEKLVGDRDRDRYTPWRDLLQSGASTIEDSEQAAAICNLPVPPLPIHDSFLGMSYLLGGNRHTWYNHTFTPNSPSPDCACQDSSASEAAITARSRHPSGVNGSIADGSARFIADQIDLRVWKALATRAGSDSVTLE